MLLNKNTIQSNRGNREGEPLIRIKDNKMKFSVGALKLLGANGTKLFIQFKYENQNLLAIVGPSSDAFVANINPKTAQCSIGLKALIGQVLKLMQAQNEVILKVNPAIELRHEGFLQFPLTKV